MKHKTDRDGNTQLNFFSAATIDVINMPTKEKHVVRFNEVMRLIECGDADYSRLIGQVDRLRYVASMKNYKWCWVDGERVSVVEAKALVKFLDSWVSRRRYYHDELKSLQRSIDFYEHQRSAK